VKSNISTLSITNGRHILVEVGIVASLISVHSVQAAPNGAKSRHGNSLGGYLTSPPVVVPIAGGAVNVFALGKDHALDRLVYTPGKGSTGWTSLGGYLTSPPVVVPIAG